MTSAPAHYRLAPPVTDEAAGALAAYPPLTRQLLYARGITDAVEAAAFLAPDYAARHDPFLMTDMTRAVERVERALASGERIAIYSDYDCDGIPGGVLLHDFFRAVGHQNFENYIPHRHDEGYGMSVAAVEKLADRGATLLVTVDCGIGDHTAIVYARERGLDVIVVDHHEPDAELPEAYAILNPKRDTAYPFRELCGTGVAWKLIEALLARDRRSLPLGAEKWWLDAVGLATVADMVPLRGENRLLAHYGLTVLRKTRRPGLRHLLRGLRLDARHLTEDDIGFSIGPRINAASRMDTPEDAFRMLATASEAEAGTAARHLEKLNNERKGVVAAMVKEAKRRVAALPEPRDVLVLGDPLWRPALAGLAANTLAETYGRPAFVWGRDGRGVIKGSCRSGGTASVVALMRGAHDAFLEYGGHHASGGFSVADARIHALDDALNGAHVALDAGTLERAERTVDARLTLDEVTEDLVRELATLAPYGMGNEKPLFAIAATPGAVECFGKGREHVKVRLDTRGSAREAIAFFATPDSFTTPLVPEQPATLLAHVERSFFAGRMQTRLRLVDVLPSDVELW